MMTTNSITDGHLLKLLDKLTRLRFIRRTLRLKLASNQHEIDETIKVIGDEHLISEEETTILIPMKTVCRRLGVSDKTLMRWLAKPEMNFPRPYRLGREYKFNDAEINEWMEKQRA